MLETNEGVLHESMAIAKFLANGHQTLLGTNDLERAQIDQWTNWVLELSGKLDKVCFAILGTEPIEQTEFNDSIKEIKEAGATMFVATPDCEYLLTTLSATSISFSLK